MTAQSRCRDSFVTIMKRMPLKVRAVLIVCCLVVVVEIISGIIDLNFNYKGVHKMKGRRGVEVGKHRERKEVNNGMLGNTSDTEVGVGRVTTSLDDEDENISEPPTEVLEVPGEGGGHKRGRNGGVAVDGGSTHNNGSDGHREDGTTSSAAVAEDERTSSVPQGSLGSSSEGEVNGVLDAVVSSSNTSTP